LRRSGRGFTILHAFQRRRAEAPTSRRDAKACGSGFWACDAAHLAARSVKISPAISVSHKGENAGRPLVGVMHYPSLPTEPFAGSSANEHALLMWYLPFIIFSGACDRAMNPDEDTDAQVADGPLPTLSIPTKELLVRFSGCYSGRPTWAQPGSRSSNRITVTGRHEFPRAVGMRRAPWIRHALSASDGLPVSADLQAVAVVLDLVHPSGPGRSRGWEHRVDGTVSATCGRWHVAQILARGHRLESEPRRHALWTQCQIVTSRPS
jgi:hypothetical protein